MKQSTRILGIIMAVVMLLSAIPFGAHAAYAQYVTAGGYNKLDQPYVTAQQAASMLLDMVDKQLQEADIKFTVDIYISSKTLELTSIDTAINSITSFWNWNYLNYAFDLFSFGDIERMDMYWIKNCPLRTSPGQTDIDVIIGLAKFMKANYERIGKIIDDTFDYGFVETVTDLPATVHDIPGTLKASVLKSLNDGVDPPAGTTANSLVQKLIDSLIVGTYDPATDTYEGGIMPGLAGKTNIFTTSVYTLTTDLINAGIKDIVVPLLARMILELAGVDFSPEYPGGDPSTVQNLDMVIEIVVGIMGTEIVYEPEDLLTPLSKMTAALEFLLVDGGFHSFAYLDDTGLHITDAFVTFISDIVRVALSLIPNLGFLKATTVFKTEAEINAMTMPECYAYLARLLINEFVEYAEIPETATTIRSVLTYLLISMSKDILPEYDFDAMIAAGTLNPDTDGIFKVGTVLIRYYLNGMTDMAIPINLTFEQTLSHVVNYLLNKYPGLFDTSDILPTDSVWTKIDKIIFDIIPLNWLPAQFTGSQYLIMNWLIGNVLDFNYVGLLSIVYRNPNSELNKPVVTVLFNTIARLVNGMFGNRAIMPMNINSVDAIFGKSTLRSIIQTLSQYLADYANTMLGSLLPIVTKLIGLWSDATYVRKAPAGTPLVTYAALKNKLLSYCPSNEGKNYYNANYFFMDQEDYSELAAFMCFDKARKEVEALLAAYEENPENLDLIANTDASYRLTYYYNRLQLRGTTSVIHLNKLIQKCAAANYQQADYTAASWSAYQTAYNFAVAVKNAALADTTGTYRQSKISAARHMLMKAVLGLKPFVPFADYLQLDYYVQQANEMLNTMDFSQYTSASIQAFIATLNATQAFRRDITADQQTLVDAQAQALYDAMYGLVYLLPPGIAPVLDSSVDYYGNPITPVVVNNSPTQRFIFGLTYGGFQDSFVRTIGGAVLSVVPTSFGRGTGTRVRLAFGGIVIATYYAVLFGDINGDGNIDSGDSGLIIDYENFYLNWNAAPFKVKAGDVNGDGNVDTSDAGVVTDVENYICSIDQTSGNFFML